MYSKKSMLNRSVRKLNLKLGKDSWLIYQGFMAKVLEDYPIEIANKVNGLIRAKDFVKLLEWADSFSKTSAAEHRGLAFTRASSQLTALIKKYPFPAVGLKETARSTAWNKFLSAEQRCRRYNLKFQRLEKGRWDTQNDIHQRISAYIAYVIGFTPDHDAMSEYCGFGPGASIGVHGNSTNLGRKLLSESWTCTPSALPYAISALARDGHILELLLKGNDRYTCLDTAKYREVLRSRVRLVQHNKIVFVPKATLVDRTIAVEPLLNGYLQKGVDVFMRRRLKRVGIDLSDQSRNQRLARLGSNPLENDPFVTIDLSSASDSLSTEMLRRVLPYDWFVYLNNLRAKNYTLDDKIYYPYHKFVSMGNGFCFPLETLIFASVCQLYSKPDDFSVYGDDIIVRQSVAHKVLQTLKKLGFRHNSEKTFLEGPFRESCGADWFEGQDVRPLTLDSPLDSLQEIIKFFNLSQRKDFWSCRFHQVREYLMELVPLELRFCRPYRGNEFGAFEVPLDKFQSSPFSRWDRYTQCWKWLELDETGRSDKDLMSHKERYFTVLTMAALRGSPSRMPFSKRRETSQTVRVKAYAGATSTWLPPSCKV